MGMRRRRDGAPHMLVMEEQRKVEVETVAAQHAHQEGGALAASLIGTSETTSGRDAMFSNRGAGKQS